MSAAIEMERARAPARVLPACLFFNDEARHQNNLPIRRFQWRNRPRGEAGRPIPIAQHRQVCPRRHHHHQSAFGKVHQQALCTPRHKKQTPHLFKIILIEHSHAAAPLQSRHYSAKARQSTKTIPLTFRGGKGPAAIDADRPPPAERFPSRNLDTAHDSIVVAPA